jgi:hypothetical protein
MFEKFYNHFLILSFPVDNLNVYTLPHFDIEIVVGGWGGRRRR